MKPQQLELEKEFSQVQSLCPEQGNVRPFYSRGTGDSEQRRGLPTSHSYYPWTRKQDHKNNASSTALYNQDHRIQRRLLYPKQAHSYQAVLLWKCKNWDVAKYNIKVKIMSIIGTNWSTLVWLASKWEIDGHLYFVEKETLEISQRKN